jgi:hypothetical protein
MIKSVLDADSTAWAFRIGDMTHRGSAIEHETYWTPTWGRFPSERTIDTQGDHDWWNIKYTPSEQPAVHYYNYTGSPKNGAWNLGNYWRLYSLCCESVDKGGVNQSEQLEWLESDLNQHAASRHIIAMTHKPLFVNLCLNHGDSSYPFRVKPMWEVLQQYGCEFFMAGHAHRFEAWRPKLADGTWNGQRGIRQFVIGTGGVTLRLVDGAIHSDCEFVFEEHGITQFTLRPTDYIWKFTNSSGVVRATKTRLCRKVLT